MTPEELSFPLDEIVSFADRCTMELRKGRLSRSVLPRHRVLGLTCLIRRFAAGPCLFVDPRVVCWIRPPLRGGTDRAASPQFSLSVVLNNPTEPPVAPGVSSGPRKIAVLHHRSRSPRLRAAGR